MIRQACIEAAREGFRDASVSGLCTDGAIEAAIGAIQSLKLENFLNKQDKKNMNDPNNQPQLEVLNSGDTLKILQVTGLAGMSMPKHHSTGEAMIIVQKGMASLKMQDSEQILSKGDIFNIPAGKAHALTLKTDFETLVVMPVDSAIEFESH